MNLAELPKNSYAVIRDPECWADRMMVYRTVENKLVVFDTIRVDRYNPVWDKNQQEKVCIVAFKGEINAGL